MIDIETSFLVSSFYFKVIVTIVGITTIPAFVMGGMVLRAKKKYSTLIKQQASFSGDYEKDMTARNEEETKEEDDEMIEDHPTSVIITLPEWTKQFYKNRKDKVYTTDKEMMGVAMELSKVNCEENTGGPFGTAIFEYDIQRKEGKLFSIGVNRVVPCSNSTLHGEMTAIQFGQQKIGNFSFASSSSTCVEVPSKKKNKKEYHLYTSCAPCCQCLGGVLWSGVSKLVCGATKADAEAIGFDEGPVYETSYQALEKAGCKVVKDVLRNECNEILQWYGNNGPIYNP